MQPPNVMWKLLEYESLERALKSRTLVTSGCNMKSNHLGLGGLSLAIAQHWSSELLILWSLLCI